MKNSNNNFDNSTNLESQFAQTLSQSDQLIENLKSSLADANNKVKNLQAQLEDAQLNNDEYKSKMMEVKKQLPLMQKQILPTDEMQYLLQCKADVILRKIYAEKNGFLFNDDVSLKELKKANFPMQLINDDEEEIKTINYILSKNENGNFDISENDETN